jgi:hypothetical protein
VAAGLKEAKRLYLEERKAEAEEMSPTLQDRVTELDGILTAGIRTDPLVTFRSLKRKETYPLFALGRSANRSLRRYGSSSLLTSLADSPGEQARPGTPAKSKKRVRHSPTPVGSTQPQR